MVVVRISRVIVRYGSVRLSRVLLLGRLIVLLCLCGIIMNSNSISVMVVWLKVK